MIKCPAMVEHSRAPCHPKLKFQTYSIYPSPLLLSALMRIWANGMIA